MRLSRLLPDLYFDHPGYFTVAVSLLLTHVVLALDAAQRSRHLTALWTVANAMTGGAFWVWTAIHVVIVGLIVAGLYWRFPLARWGFLLSLVTFNGLGVALFAAALMHGLSFYAAVTSFSLSLSSLATYREPAVNPLHRKARPHDRR